MTTATPSVLTWHLRERMQDAGLVHIVDLEQALRALGINISAVQLGRMLQRPPKHLPLDLLGGLLTVLHCRPEELLVWQPAQARDAHTLVPCVRGPRRRKPVVAQRELSDAERAALVGPPVRGMPAKTMKVGGSR